MEVKKLIEMIESLSVFDRALVDTTVNVLYDAQVLREKEEDQENSIERQ